MEITKTNVRPLLKRAIAVFMAVLMVMSTLGVGLAFAAEEAAGAAEVLTNGDCGYNDDEDYNDDSVKWELYDDGTVRIFGEGMMRDWVHPWTDYAEENCIEELNVYVEEGITHLGEYSMYGSIIKSVQLPESLKTIGSEAFYYSDIEKIYIPAGVDYISGSAFGRCYSLGEITVDEKNETYYTDDYGALYGNVEIWSEVDDEYYYGKALLYFPGASDVTKYTVPADTDRVYSYAFSSVQNLDKITIAGENTHIESFGYNDSIKEVIGYTASSAYFRAISEGISFTSINGVEIVSAELTKLPYKLRYEIGYDYGVIHNGIEITMTLSDGSKIKTDGFYCGFGYDFEEVGANTINVYFDKYEFSYDIEVYAKRYIEPDAEAEFEAVVNSREYFYFNADKAAKYAVNAELDSDCNITVSVGYEETWYEDGEEYTNYNWEEIQADWFYADKDKQSRFYTQEGEIYRIGIEANGETEGLIKGSVVIEEKEPVILPEGYIASGNCGMFGDDDNNVTDDVKWAIYEDGTLYIDGEGKMISSYKPWLEYVQDEGLEITNIFICEGITQIGSDAFSYLEDVKTVSLPESLEVIKWSAFRGCVSIESVHIPANVKEISDGAFLYCNSLRGFAVNEANENFFADADGCLYEIYEDGTKALVQFPVAAEINEYTIGEDVITVYDYAFEGVKNLRKVIFKSPDTYVYSFGWDNSIQTVEGFAGSYAHFEAENEGKNFISTDGVEVESIELTKAPIVREYDVANDFNWPGLSTAGMEIKVNLSDGSYKIVDSSKISFSYSCDFSEPGEKTATIWCLGEHLEFTVMVHPTTYLTLGEGTEFNIYDDENRSLYFVPEETGKYTFRVDTALEDCYIEVTRVKLHYTEDGELDYTNWYTIYDGDNKNVVLNLTAGETYIFQCENSNDEGIIYPATATIIKGLSEPVAPEEETTEPTTEPATKPSVTEPTTKPATTKPSAEATTKPTTAKPTEAKPTTTKAPAVVTTTKAPATAAPTTKAPETTKKQETVVKAKKPVKVKAKKPKSAKAKTVVFTWAKVKNANGYQLAYSTSKKFTKKTTKTKLIKKAKTTKTTIKKLKSGKKYFIRIRAYRTVKGKKVYGAWSKVMNVKVK